MTEALQMNIEATDRAHEIVKFDRQTLGFDIEVWLTAMRGQTLVMLGRGDEARPFLDRVLQKAETDVDAIHYVIPSLAYVDMAWANRDPQLALEHALATVRIAEDAQILACVDGDRRKLAVVREISKLVEERRARSAAATAPVLEAYVA
jgi:hypothetical protein